MNSIFKAGWAAAALFASVIASGCASDTTALVDKDPTRIICRNEPDTGSRLPKKTCMEAREWEAIAEANQQAKRDLRRSTTDIRTGELD